MGEMGNIFTQLTVIYAELNGTWASQTETATLLQPDSIACVVNLNLIDLVVLFIFS